MRSRRRPAVVVALGAATLLLLTGTAPAVADDPAAPNDTTPATTADTPEPQPTPEPTPEPTPDPTPTDTPAPSPTEESEESEPGEKVEPNDTSPSEPTGIPTTPSVDRAAPTDGPATPAAAEPTGITIDPGTNEITVGEAASLTVWTVDDSGTHLVDVTEEAGYEFVGGRGSCTAGSCTTTVAGYFAIKVTWGAFTNIAGLVARPGPAVGISLSPATATLGVDDQQLFTAYALDQYGNASTVADDTDFTGEAGLDCVDDSPGRARCSASTPGTYTLTATLRSDPSRTADASLSVVEENDTLTRIEVSVQESTVVAGEPIVVKVAGRSASGQYVDVTDRATFQIWQADSLTALDLSDPQPCPAGTCTMTRAGGYVVAATVGQLTGGTGVEVIAAAATGLAISPADAAATVGVTQTFQAEDVDAFGNRTVTDSATYTIEAPGTCTTNACGSATPGSYTVTATADGHSATARLNVHADVRPTEEIARIELRPSAPSVTAGEPGTFAVYAYDADGRPLGTVTAETSLEIEGAGTWRTPFGLHSLGCSADTCTSTVAGRHAVTGRFGELTATSTLVVVPGALAISGIAPGNALIRAGGTQTFTPGVMDQYGNLAQPSGLPFGMELAASNGASCTGTVCGSTKAGVYVIRIASVNGVEAGAGGPFFGFLTVIPAEADHLTLDPFTARVPAGTAVELTATAYDEYDNAIGDVTEETTFTTGPGASCETSRCSSTVAGSYPITGTHDGMTGTAQLTVVPGPVDRVVVSPGTASIRTGETQAFTTAGFDAYDNAVGDLTDDTTFTVSEPGACTANACGSTQAGELTVTGSYVVPGLPLRQRIASGRFGAVFAAAPGDTVTGTALLTITAPSTPNPGTTDPGAGTPGGAAPGTGGAPGDGGKNGGKNGGAQGGAGGDGSGAGGQSADAGEAGALPATGSGLEWWHGLAAALLLLAGLAVVLIPQRSGRRAL
ncbi:hypothetical protein RB608_06510 [Nocardioides sp. LHD-245]|uniref:hypothetical protein n=1 Tax=Nocardioides sp. LHD-245 TaxID=3051387 RepID=UPI0027E167AA|nr:hypothetical protein [Nocardioides sp. LHD-245]